MQSTTAIYQSKIYDVERQVRYENVLSAIKLGLFTDDKNIYEFLKNYLYEQKNGRKRRSRSVSTCLSTAVRTSTIRGRK